MIKSRYYNLKPWATQILDISFPFPFPILVLVQHHLELENHWGFNLFCNATLRIMTYSFNVLHQNSLFLSHAHTYTLLKDSRETIFQFEQIYVQTCSIVISNYWFAFFGLKFSCYLLRVTMWLSKSINRSCYVQAGYVGEDVESILYKLLTVILTSLFTYLHHKFFFFWKSNIFWK